jgi:hypothetical protein
MSGATEAREDGLKATADGARGHGLRRYAVAGGVAAVAGSLIFGPDAVSAVGHLVSSIPAIHDTPTLVEATVGGLGGLGLATGLGAITSKNDGRTMGLWAVASGLFAGAGVAGGLMGLDSGGAAAGLGIAGGLIGAIGTAGAAEVLEGETKKLSGRSPAEIASFMRGVALAPATVGVGGIVASAVLAAHGHPAQLPVAEGIGIVGASLAAPTLVASGIRQTEHRRLVRRGAVASNRQLGE